MKSKRSSLDRISTLPESILETILCLLSTKEAARTSILSTEWRYKWTKISKLDFFVPPNKKRIATRRKPFHDLYQVLLLHRGLIHEFSLHMNQSTSYQDSIGFDQVLLQLFKNHKLEKLKLFGCYGFSCLNLPISIFSLRHLIELDIRCFTLDHQPTFNGFGSLRRLSLIDVRISTKTLLHLLSNCPSLKSLTLSVGASHLGGEGCTIIELFKCLPMIEQLTTYGDVFKCLVLDSVPQKLSTLLSHLKYFCFREMDSDDGYGLAFLLVLIKCSPNLEKIKINRLRTRCKRCPVVWKDYSDVLLEHLNELKIECFSSSKPEMEFVKFILARSLKLKKVRLCCAVGRNQEEMEMLKILLEAPRASAAAVVTIRYSCFKTFR